MGPSRLRPIGGAFITTFGGRGRDCSPGVSDSLGESAVSDKGGGCGIAFGGGGLGSAIGFDFVFKGGNVAFAFSALRCLALLGRGFDNG